MAWISRLNLLREQSSRGSSPRRRFLTLRTSALHDSDPIRPSQPNQPFAASLTDNLPIYADAIDPRAHCGSSGASLWSGNDTDDDRAEERARVQISTVVARIESLQSSLANPELLPGVRRVLETALTQFVRSERSAQELLPPYSEDCRPPYSETAVC